MRKLTLTLLDDKQLEKIGDSLSSAVRRKILLLVSHSSYTLMELAEQLGVALSTTSFHVKILKEAGLIKVLASPSRKGNEKNISIDCDSMLLYFNGVVDVSNLREVVNIPLGSFIEANIKAPCAICTSEKVLEPLDDINVFASPMRINAQLISFYQGYITYPLPLNNASMAKVSSISIFLELCSECPNYNNSWKSHITFWLNDVEIATYLSPGDYGDRRGNYTPNWWPDGSTQYGMPTTITINSSGSFINGALASATTIADLGLTLKQINKLKIGLKDDSKYIGGVNLFGAKFGDIDEDIIVTVTYEQPAK
ncbi:MAG TPA: helix-turn-helix domain-containing protein [Bacilli bacterium]|nr:helix-turn-helix domain-containing protein [Bacilli bacterium]